MRVLRLAGTAHERGAAYGEQTRDEIRECIRVYERWFESFANISWSAARELGEPYRDWLRAAEPDLGEEIDGIAAGADLPVADIIALNFRTEIAYGASGLMSASECTSLGVPPVSTTNGHVYLAENWDWLADTLPLTLMLDFEPVEGLRMVTVTEAGMVAKFGMNSDGVGLCVNLLGSNVNRVGGSFHTLARGVLQSRSALEAVWSVTGSERGGSGNYVIGSSSGEIVDLEYSPAGYTLHFPEHGYVAHANHFLGKQAGVLDRTQILRNISPGSYFRQARAEHLLSDAASSTGINVKEIQSILGDHQGEPEGICRHGGPVGKHQVLGRTNVSVVMDLTDLTMYLGHGFGCSADIEQYQLTAEQFSKV